MNDFYTPFISIVIPTYNHAVFLKKALQSICEQTYINWEAIIVDNNSIDNTEEIVKEFNESRFILKKINNHGVIAESRNLGIKVAKGKWVAFLDSDDWWLPTKLEKSIEYINPSVDFIYHRLNIERDNKSIFDIEKKTGRRLVNNITIDLLENGNPIATSSVFVRKEIVKKVGMFDEDKKMIASEDYNLWLRISEVVNDMKYIPESLGYYRMHDKSVSKRDMSISTQYACNKYENLLNHKQYIKYSSALKYQKGRYNFIDNKYDIAKEDLKFVIKNGCFFLKVKSCFMLSIIISKLVFSRFL